MMSRKRERGEHTSHKVIEKRRRDRINNCLSELSQTVPAAFAKQTSGKLEKAEILEMTVEYLRAIQRTGLTAKFENGYAPESVTQEFYSELAQHHQAGYNDCIREIARYLTDIEGIDINDTRCMRIMSYLQQRYRPDYVSMATTASMANNASSSSSSEHTRPEMSNGYSSAQTHMSSCTSTKSISTEQLNPSPLHQPAHHHHHHLSGLHRCNAHTHHFCSYTVPSNISNCELKNTSTLISGCPGMLTSSCSVAMPTPIKAASPLYATSSTLPGPVSNLKPANHCVPAFTAINTARVKPLQSHFPSLMTSHMTSSTPLSVASSNGILSHSVVVP
ncbi:hairy and enhancer of split-related protein helt-like [Ptychodera flava]|uniref:hairy and enhancer of split-related protein helt-like n=1 Tax=Ptychodera flava TaxID=63121 RepID=UPI00396A681C